MTKSILLACAGGYSTSMLVEKMKKAAKVQELEVVIEATAESNIAAFANTIDVILLGPQMGHMESEIAGKYDVPVSTIDMMDYGMMNGDKVLATALELIEAGKN